MTRLATSQAADADRSALTTRDTELLVIGAGLAGLSTALAAAPRKVTILTKTASLGSGSSWWAQGGVAAVWDKADRVEDHVRDTLEAGDGLGDRELADLLARDGPAVVASLIERGMPFDRNRDGAIDLALEGGHGQRRILHAGGDATGRELSRFLLRLVGTTGSVTMEARAFAWDLVIRDGRVAGLLAYHEDRGWVLHRTRHVVIASGGSGQLFGRTTNPPEATADGLALAARAGATLKDLEFVQFHPTALAGAKASRVGPGSPTDLTRTPLLTEALRGEGAFLVDDRGTRFMADLHAHGDLAPRDIVARAVDARIRAGRTVYLDTREAIGAAIAERFPTVHTQCLEAGIDPVGDPIAVTPAAHFHMGGIETDRDGRSDLPGLWAVGEAASTGLHGANRMAGNALLECLSFGPRIAAAIDREGPPEALAQVGEIALPPPPPVAATEPVLAAMKGRLHALMYDGVGLVRDATGLGEALAGTALLADQAASLAGADHGVPAGRRAGVRPWGELRNMMLAARLIGEAALAHRGSRGAHWRSDYPERAASWDRRSVAKARDGLAA